MSLDLVLLVIAAVLFAIAAFARGHIGDTGARFDLVAAGLFFFTLTFIL